MTEYSSELRQALITNLSPLKVRPIDSQSEIPVTYCHVDKLSAEFVVGARVLITVNAHAVFLVSAMPPPVGGYLTPAEADALFLTPAEGNAAYLPSASVDWTAWAPTVRHGTNLATWGNDSRYWRANRLVVAQYALALFSNPVGQINVDLPFLARMPGAAFTPSQSWGQALGTFSFITTAGVQTYGHCQLGNDGSYFWMMSYAGTVMSNAQITAAWDNLYAQIIYEART